MAHKPKFCSTCKIVKPVSDFYFNKSNLYLEKHCMQCRYIKYGSKPSKAKQLVYRNSYKAKNPWYIALCAARQRCNYKSNCNYKYYGGKGIKCLLTIKEIKQLWIRDNAESLVKPSIDRIDPNKDYTFANCRFIEHSQNVALKWSYGKA